MSGILIAVCGIDGSGKSTQIENLRAHFTHLGRPPIVTRQPTERYRGDPVVRAALELEVDALTRDLVYAELALLAAWDRARHVREIIRPALAAGGVIISDRYVYSSFAYFMARGIRDIDWLKQLNRDVPEPTLTLYLDVAPETAIARVTKRTASPATREETALERMREVRAQFLSAPWGRQASYITIDAERTERQVWKDICDVLDQWIETE